MENKHLEVLVLGLAGLTAGCSGVIVSQGLAKRTGPLMDDKVIAPVPVEPELRSGDSPADATYNENEQKRFECERQHYQLALRADREGRAIPERNCGPYTKLDLNKHKDFLDNREDKTSAEQSRDYTKLINERLLGAIEKNIPITVNNDNKDESASTNSYTPSDNSKVEIKPIINGGVSSEVIKEFNRQKQSLYSPGTNSLTLEEQYAICRETEEGKALAEYLGEVAFEDCKHAPQEAEDNSMRNLVDKLTKSIKQGDLILYCGMTTEPSADQCPPYTDQGNLGLAWDRAHDTGRYCESKLPGTTSLGFALGINGKRAARAYKLRRGG